MVFTETKDKQCNPSGNTDGLPLQWDALASDACPRCREDLIEFEHVDLWKCACGFKISIYKKERIVAKIDSVANGYMFGNYEDENPF